MLRPPLDPLLAEKSLQEINGQREDVGVVVLCRYGVEGLQVTQLERGRRLVNDVSSLSQLL